MTVIAFILLQLNHSKSYFSIPYDSTTGIPPKVLYIVYGIVLIFGVFAFFKVRKMIRDERNGKGR